MFLKSIFNAGLFEISRICDVRSVVWYSNNEFGTMHITNENVLN